MKPSGAFLKHGRVIIALDKVCYKIRKNIYSDGNSAKSTILRRFLTPNKFFILVHKIPKKGNAISIVQVLQKKNGPVFMARYLHFVGKPFLKKISRKYQVRSQFKIFLEKVPVQNSRKKIIKASLPKVFTNQESVAEMFEIDVNANNVEIEEHKLQRERENMKEQDTLIEAPELTDDSFLLPIKNEEEEEKIVALKTEFQNQCVICSEVFANAARLKTHHRYHVKREKLLKDVSSTVETKRQFRFRYYCPHWGCQKCYMSSSSAKYHARSHAEVVKENVKSLPTYFLFTNGLFKCRLCVEGFESIEKVRAHYLQCEGKAFNHIS